MRQLLPEAISISDNRDIRCSDLGEPWVLVATGLGLGLSPAAPGTVASVFAVLVWWLVLTFGGPHAHGVMTLASMPVFFYALMWTCRRHDLGDHRSLVADEVLGQWIALLYVPLNLWSALMALVLFRLLDILKPFPIRWLDRNVKGAWGVLLDDVAAGAFACAFTHALTFLLLE